MLPPLDLALPTATIIAIAAYLLGSIPFGMVVAKAMGLGNLREIGSGNIGTTNVLRTGSKLGAFLTLVLDSGKGGVAVLIAGAMYGQAAAQVAGLCVFLGHLYPVWLGFRGGKGVATFLGILLALNFPAGLVACATWLITALVGRISSASALVCAALAPLWLGLLGMPTAMVLAAILAVLIWIKHWANIARILAGTEPKIGAGK
ncbi:MAG: glycerol-3-phosphate 1-O-acyltransferase PlsY [Rhodobacteraceae bacterium]|nr:glycerol-3-phosphate 1-O-acyltransferase PlsY [Paracoccaceae bacterium]